ncbi:MAG: DUF3560 domain-containing protein [Polyangiaceae bacterium]|jgi:hypothetical protein
MLTRAQAARQRRELWRDIGREERKQVREKLARLKQAVREARARRAIALREAAAQCKADRVAAHERAHESRVRIANEVRRAVEGERAAAREACAARTRDAALIKDEVERARVELAAEREHQKELRIIEKTGRERLRAAILVGETDEEVREQIAAPLHPLFEAVKHRVSATSEASRTEQFLRHAETHPDAVLAAIEHPAETELRDLEREHAEAVREYEGKRAARVDRMRTRAERLKRASEAALSRSRQISEAIPLGQPILVGHHSEKRHRRDIERIQRGFTQGIELQKEAEALERRASRAEENPAISSDDPNAVRKLVEKLEQLEKDRARMVAANKAVRSGRPREALAELGLSERMIERILTPDPLGHIGFPSYALSNAAGEAGRLRRRISELRARAERPAPPPVERGRIRIEEAENRVRVFFPDKPDASLRTTLKKAGFRWSPTVGAWQRHASNQAWYEAKRIVDEAGAP